ncbi:MAG: hypothetical protein EAX87_03780 [Candidatus Thorarchaeota archaeon]|nr:hypothetical protein [Candidatus Thorarchaeota archaeon]
MNSSSVIFVAMIVVTILLNFGLFFILNFLAPLVTGLIVGYIVAKYIHAIAIVFSGTALSYFLVFLITEWFLDFVYKPEDVIFAVIIMSGIGVLGGAIGSFVGARRSKTK